MDFKKYYLEMILKYIIENNPNSISTKRLRRHFKIESEDRSFINFVWRTLRSLEKNNCLVIDRQKPKVYSLTEGFKLLLNKKKTKSEQETLLKDLCKRIN